MQIFTKQLILSGFLLITIQVIAQFNTRVPQVDHVLHISVDGLRPDVLTSLGAEKAPNFFRFRTEGAWTDNARTDVLNTSTIPGHTSHITGRPVFGDHGHGFWWNSDPGPFTLHTGKYISSVFDVVHDHGFSTALYAGKGKFVLFENSYDSDSGAGDITGIDNGRDKIDTYVNNGNMNVLTTAFIRDYEAKQYEYAFFHFRYPDGEGHATGWELDISSEYAQKVAEIDALIGQFFQTIESTPGLANRTAIILTADHGGEKGKKNHGNLFDPDNYTIPFYVWGPGIEAGADLYALNTDVRNDPGSEQPTDDVSLLPIRYGEVANLTLSLLGLPSVPGSFYNVDQSLKVNQPEDNKIVIFQQGLNGYQGTVDTYVRRHESSNSYGSETELLVDDADPWWSGRDNQTLLRFENLIGMGMGQIPPNIFIENATLQLRVVNDGNGGSFHRMLTSWDENESWDSLGNGISANDQEAKTQPDKRISDAKKGILSIDVTTGVQAWVEGQVNHGWAILPDGGNGWDFYSSEGFMPPRLVISYTEEFPKITVPIADKEEGKEDNLSTNNSKKEDINSITSGKSVEPLLWGNFPNPFTDSTTIGFSIPKEQHVTVAIYNAQATLVTMLINKKCKAGRYLLPFEADNLTEGMYIVEFITENSTGGIIKQSKKIIHTR
ncbi:alkaline phosphatase family protein [Aquimarina sp. RZ0]|uniref:alkaline phosphatase family protein n=1 Tax=Aquimarina sp. RZ0 TaxID=2607730 RepID=UPI0011F2F1EC|nr:alkaline phosphatase family protein [Aquimarina sp. RZ0]KAA1246801.1 DNRLRE domain-containing protein [Aquimarina sp. RZ0]